MKQFDIFGEVKTNNTVKNIIVDEIKRRYGKSSNLAFFNNLKSYNAGTIDDDYVPTFPFFMLKHEEEPSTHSLLKRLFGGYKITNPLLYAKRLVEDAAPKERHYQLNALEELHKLAEKIRKQKVDDYDFEIDGIPVKIYQKFIQVGYDIIPLNNYSGYFANLKDEEKKETIFNIIVNINNNFTKIAA